MKLRVVLVEPMYDGNVGSIARVMKNFGFHRLVLVNPCPIGDFGLAMASHSKDLIENAQIVSSLEEAIQRTNLVVGTSGVEVLNTDDHLRVPSFSPDKLASSLQGTKGEIALLLGREDNGLTREELQICDMIVTIPTSQEYSIMNISHAAALILYSLSQVKKGEIALASRDDMDRLYDHFKSALAEVRYPPHKLEKTMLMLRRVFGRSQLTDREVQTLHGVICSLGWQHRSQRDEKDRNLDARLQKS
ncbi:MAG: RNA methyltransferase [Methanotrichaceae archaeon]